jgi:cell division cycle 2-like
MGVKQYGAAVDMWSVGCIFGELRLRELLLPGKVDTDLSQLAKIFHTFGTPSEESWPGFTLLPYYPKLASPLVQRATSPSSSSLS